MKLDSLASLAKQITMWVTQLFKLKVKLEIKHHVLKPRRQNYTFQLCFFIKKGIYIWSKMIEISDLSLATVFQPVDTLFLCIHYWHETDLRFVGGNLNEERKEFCAFCWLYCCI